MNTQPKTWLVSNHEDKAVIVTAESSDEARRKANEYYYQPWPNKRDLNTTQVLADSHCHLEHKVFKKVQFHAMGGVVTTYDGTVRTQPTQAQLDFLNRPIVYVKLTNE